MDMQNVGTNKQPIFNNRYANKQLVNNDNWYLKY